MANTDSIKALPYRDPAVGDLIIRTSDDVDFYVQHRRIADVCPIFADMAILPNHPSDCAVSSENERALVRVSETSKVWEKLLPICHLEEEPSLSLEDIMNLLEAGHKYGMAGIASRMRTALLHPDFLEQKPFAVYALACAGGFDDVARLAARRTLRFPIYPQDTPEFASITGRALYRLFDYRQRCGIATSAVVTCQSKPGYLPRIPAWMSSSDCASFRTCMSSGCPTPSSDFMIPHEGYQNGLISSWVTYMDRLSEEFKSHPDSDLLESPALLQAVLDSMDKCSTCRKSFYRNATAFTKIIKEKVNDAIGQVQLVLEK
ncbi:hypothetical protein K466DRAFT_392418 [Polyporus arcularius HHB13444]|uniref:BTB domain-containing protein n=1 Tax=Polyporus arcularius HHB13444 TaxID=1314778 RepID=A0A5C3NVX4_9APHY|nr:hypothetical protein K466DRAFT_392418 [Polyporus arcularius HHB13444]